MADLNRTLFISFALMFSLVACKPRQESQFVPAEVVLTALSHEQSPEYQLIRSIQNGSTKGNIALIDRPDRCILLSEAFLKADYFDNVDGGKHMDGLPDFSGETVCSLMDIADSPYFTVAEGRGPVLRELTVRAVLAALDTNCVNTDDGIVKRNSKPRAKAIVLSSPAMALYGLKDVDTLMRGAGIEIPVLSPVTSMISSAVSGHGGALNAVVLAERDIIASGVYQSLFASMAPCSGNVASVIETVESGDGVTLRSVLDSCLVKGIQRLHALLVDDYSVSCDDLTAELQAIRESREEDDIPYIQMLSPDFRVVDPRRSVVEDCYRLFRQLNIFTHNIAYPYASAYMRIPEAAGFSLTGFDEMSLSEESRRLLSDMAPKTHDSYVQNQHFSRGN